MKGLNLVVYALIALFSLGLVSAGPELVDLRVIPSDVMPGDVVTLAYTINDVPALSRVETNVVMPPNLINHRDVRNVPGGAFQYVESFRVPDVPKGEYPLLLRLTIVGFPPLYQEMTINVGSHKDKVDTKPVVRKPVAKAEAVDVNIKAGKEILRGGAAYYPITITNDAGSATKVTLSLEGAENWATYRIDPQPTINVPAHGEAEAFVYFAVDDDAPLGTNTFDLKAEHVRTDFEPVTIAVLAKEPLPQTNWVLALVVIIIVLALALIVGTLLYHNKEGGDDDDDLITYY